MINAIYDKYVELPHTPDKYGICKYCGEGSIVLTVSEGMRVQVSYGLESDKVTLSYIIFSASSFAGNYDHVHSESLGSGKTKYTEI